MDGNANWRPNEQGGDSLANNANDWRSQHDPSLRKRVIAKIVEKLKEYYPKSHTDARENDIYNSAAKFEKKTYATAKNKDDYLRKLSEKMHMMEKTFQNNKQFGSSVNATNTPNPASQVVNQGQSLPTSLPYMQTSRSQQWLPQNTQSNLNIIESSCLPTQVPINVSVPQAQNVNIHIGEGVQINLLPGTQIQMQGRQQLHPQQQTPQQQQPQHSNNVFQNQMNQQLLKEKIRHGNLRPTHMKQQSQSPQQQQQQHPQGLLKQPIQQSFPQSGPQNSQLLPRNQFSAQLVCSSHQQQMAMPSSQEQDRLYSKLANQEAQQRQNNGEAQHGAFRVSSSQQNSNISFPNTHQQRLNASAFSSQQLQNMSDVSRSSFLGQTQPTILQQYQPQHHPAQQQHPQNRSLPQHLDLGSLRQTQNLTDQQIQQYQFERAPIANPSTSQDSTGKTVNVNGGNWQEETYQKIKALKVKYLHLLSAMYQKFTEKLRQIESHPQPEHFEKLKVAKTLFSRILVFLSVERNTISEKHRDLYDHFEEQILRYTKHHQTELRRPMQIQQTALQSQSHQVNVAQSLDKDQMNSRLIPSNQNMASSTVSMPHSLQTRRPKMEPRDDNNIMTSSENVMLSSLIQNPVTDPQVLSSMLQQTKPKVFHHQQQEQQERQANRQLQIPTSNQSKEMNDLRMKQGINIKAELLQQHLSSSPRQLLKPTVSSSRMSNFSPSPSSSSPQIVDQQIVPTTVNQSGTPSQSSGSPFVTPSAVTPPVPGDPKTPISVESPVELGTKKQPTPVSLPPEPIEERPIDRLIKAFQQSSKRNLAESVSQIQAAVNMVDRIAGSFHPGALSEESNQNKRMKRTISALPQDFAPQTVSSTSKVNKIEPHFALQKEIKEINRRLIETVVEICDEVNSGTIVSCSYSPVALSATYKAHYMSGKISQIQPLRVLVPANYPNCSPILLEDISFDASVHINEDLSARTRMRFFLSMKEVKELASLKEIAQMWNDCARATMAEYAERHGGGTFSSKYGAWETLLGAS